MGVVEDKKGWMMEIDHLVGTDSFPDET